MKSFNDWLNESLQGDEQIKAELAKSINAHITDFKTNNAKVVADASKIVDVNSIIEQCRAYLIKSIPTIVAGLKSGKGGDVFAAGFVSFTSGLIKKELEELSFIKRGAAKLLAPDKATYLARAKRFNADPFIGSLERCLDLGFAVLTVDAVKPYENQVFQWSDSVSDWIRANADKIKTNLAGIFSSFLYA